MLEQRRGFRAVVMQVRRGRPVKIRQSYCRRKGFTDNGGQREALALGDYRYRWIARNCRRACHWKSAKPDQGRRRHRPFPIVKKLEPNEDFSRVACLEEVDSGSAPFRVFIKRICGR
jgi:hypothetical protein